MVGFGRDIEHEDTREQASELVMVGRAIYLRGWAPAGTTNHSFRTQRGFVITAAGIDKMELGPEHLLEVDEGGKAPKSADHGTLAVPAEAALHAAIYGRDEAIAAIVQTRSPAATVLARGHGKATTLMFQNDELLTRLDGVEFGDTEVTLPVVPHGTDVAALSKAVVKAVGAVKGPAWAVLLAGRGLLAWGASVAAAKRHAEAFEHLLETLLHEA